ncbi:unnamed protein product [Lactuca virosa]|uniref:Uncharacterized protein n=1 Tax=Lactuca virosa TaxID=75947 RepID=A0AAU9PEC5_9ASTR|nr:unnamed protein product [Lactuca virosa]
MRKFRSWRNLLRKKQNELGLCRSKNKTFMVFVCSILLYIAYRTTKFQLSQTKLAFTGLKGLPYGIIEPKSDLELKRIWASSSSKLKANVSIPHNLLAMPVGLKMKHNVNTVVRKFLHENFTIVLFHYDGHMDGWWDLKWSKKAVHIVAVNQTKWWFAKRYLDIVKAAGLEISQPALDPKSSDIHHRITLRKRRHIFHRRVIDPKGSVKCTSDSEGPPCTGFVEGMAPVFSRTAWHCAWHLIQNDLVHGWGMDMKLGYCAQGLKNVGVVDSEYILHQGIPTLGGPAAKKGSNDVNLAKKHHGFDMRTEIRRQSTLELDVFKQRWEKAIKEDKDWVDTFFKHKQKQASPPTTHS